MTEPQVRCPPKSFSDFASRRDREVGFSLVELLVVLLIIAILAAIAIPLYISHKENGYEAQVQSAARGAALAVDTFSIPRNGRYSSANGLTHAAVAGPNNDLLDYGYNPTASVSLLVRANATTFCVTATHSRLPTPWKFAKRVGRPQTGACVNANG